MRRRVTGLLLAALIISAGTARATVAAGAAPTRVTAPTPTSLAPVDPQDTSATWGYEDAFAGCLDCGRFPYNNWANPATYEVGAGPRGRVTVLHGVTHRVAITRYDASSYAVVKRGSVALGTGWSFAGGLVAPNGQVYVLKARSNYHERDSRAVLSVVRYSRRLDRLGTARVRGGFDDLGVYAVPVLSAADLALQGHQLYVTTGRLLYALQGLHHQVNLAFAVDNRTMRVRHCGPYASHSFSNLVAADAQDVAFAAHGDGYPRALQVSVYRGVRASRESRLAQRTPWTFPGVIGDNTTGTTLNGLTLTPTHTIITGVSVPHRRAVQGVTGNSTDLAPNVYTISTRTSTMKSRFAWISSLDPRGHRLVGQPHLVGLPDGRQVLLYDEGSGPKIDPYTRTHNTLHYVLLSASGRVLHRHSWAGARLAAVSDPVLVGSRIDWVSLRVKQVGYNTTGGTWLSAISVAKPARPRLVTR